MDKDTLLRDIRAGQASLEAALERLDDEALLAPAPGLPDWTRKDVLAHIEWWHEHSANVIEGLRTGVDPYAGGGPDGEPWDTDAWNARTLAQNWARPAPDVREGIGRSAERLLALVESCTADELFTAARAPWLEDPLAETIAWDTFRHYEEHAPHLA